jgi:putative endopeptidase
VALNGSLGDALGKLYVERYFPASAKAEIQGMVDRIKAAFARRIEAIDWMAPATKQEALAKVHNIVVGVGYPDTWKSYAGLRISPVHAYANRQAASRAAYAQQLGKIGKPLDRGEWWMNAQLVNAVNYGAIGAVIGHEISHGFDNAGALFDETGKLHNWWTAEDLKQFNAAGDALAAQFSSYEPFPGVHVNGKLTLGENIADVAGLGTAYDAYQLSLQGKPGQTLEGFTPDQRFFLGFAQAWRSKSREQALRNSLLTDVHAPGQFRALTVRNIDAWYPAFEVKEGQKLYLAPDKRVKVW